MTRRVLKTGSLIEYIEFSNDDTAGKSTIVSFTTLQQCADWIEQNRPGEVVEWRVAA